MADKVSRMIRTFIFFDLETTGLIRENSMPKITEMSLIAVSRTDICNTEEELPRVLQKLVLPINPRTLIPERVQSLTKLSNDSLKEIGSFECHVYELITYFLGRLAMPLCFVAHNGNAFDYPILLSHFRSDNKIFPEEVLSIDSLHLFRDFFNPGKKLTQQVNVSSTMSSTSCNSEDISILLNDGNDEALCAALDAAMAAYNNNTTTTSIITTTTSQPSNSKESSPSNSIKRDNKTSQAHCYEKIQRRNEKTPESRIVKLESAKNHFQDSPGDGARRRLDFVRGKLSNYKLPTVYKHIFNSPPNNAHSAEGDCLTMLRCACQLGSFFVEWADRNAVPLNCYERY